MGWIDKLQKKIVTISDTCTIDNFLFAFWVMFKVNNDLIEGFKSFNNEQYDIIKDIIDKIENHNWNKAQELWIIKIMKYKIIYQKYIFIWKRRFISTLIMT